MTDRKTKETETEVIGTLLPGQPDYKALYKKAKTAGKLTRPTYRIHNWDEDNAVLIGRIQGIKPFEGGKFDTKCNAYLIETDAGLVSFILGTYTDAQLKDSNIEGKVVHIEFVGQKQLEDSRSVNQFNVDIIGA